MNRLARLGLRYLHRLESEPTFASDDVRIGRNVSFGRNVVFNCRKVRIGDGTTFGDDVVVNATSFAIGDYGTIYSHCFFPGPGELVIGHNFWLGTACVVDSLGGTVIGNNVGAGAHSQLWTHMIFGDVLAGCRFRTAKPLEVGDDVWFVGHCLVSPIKAGARSLAMLGSVVVRDMEPDRCYGGVPAADITERVGPQFREVGIEARIAALTARLEEFGSRFGRDEVRARVRIATEPGDRLGRPAGVTVLNVADRTYTKTGSSLEHGLIRFLLPEAKFIPADARE